MRSGEGLETSYAMVPKPHKKMTEEQRKLVLNTSVNLKALYTGDDPFAEQADKGEEPF
jgi:hypothetical protein